MTKHDPGSGFSIVEVLLTLVVIGILGFTGWYVYHSRTVANKSYSSSSITANQTQAMPANPYAGWKTYTSSFEKLSFKYPSNWKSVAPDVPSNDPNADSFQVKSPSGALSVAWDSEVDSIGGACDPDVMPGGTVPADQPYPCPYWTVTDTQKLAGANLYYVDGVVTWDGTNYSPWCALQSPTSAFASSILKSGSNMGYLLFMGKNNVVTQNGQSSGTNLAGLLCGRPLNGKGLMTGTKAQATAALSNAEYKQAKLILLSAAY